MKERAKKAETSQLYFVRNAIAFHFSFFLLKKSFSLFYLKTSYKLLFVFCEGGGPVGGLQNLWNIIFLLHYI